MARHDLLSTSESTLASRSQHPCEAQSRHQQGVPHLRFTMNHQDNVLAFRLEKGSGVTTLDEKMLALTQRAQPLLPPPPEVPGKPLELVVPVQFFLR